MPAVATPTWELSWSPRWRRNGKVENILKQLYRQLPTKPRLRDFLEKLSEVAQRAERLHAVLNPSEAFQVFGAAWAN